MSRRRQIDLTVLATLSLFAFAPTARAQITEYDVFKTITYNQASNGQPITPYQYYGYVRLFPTKTTDLLAAQVTSASPLSPMILSFDGNQLVAFTPALTSQGQLDTDLPNSTVYTFAISGGTLGSQTATLTTPGSDSFSASVPFFTNNAFTALQGVNPNAAITLTWNAYSAPRGVNNPLIFMSISRVSDGVSVFAAQGSNLLTSATIPANTLQATTQYSVALTYSARVSVLNAGFAGATADSGYDLVTTLNFTTAGSTSQPGCSFVLSASSASVGSAGTTGSVQVTAPAGCTLAVSTPSQPFVTITSPTSVTVGSRPATVSYSVQANTGGNSRSSTFTIAGVPFTINQLNGCLFGLTPSSMEFSAAGGSGSINVASLGCGFTAVSNSSFLANVNVSGNQVSYSVLSNVASPSSRTGTITIGSPTGGQTFTVVQAGNAPCTFALAEASQAFTAAGGTGMATVGAPAGCSWTTLSNSPSFVTITGTPGGSGNGPLSYTVQPNTTGTPRTGTLTIAGLTYAVTQSGTSLTCTASAPTAAQVAIEGRTEVMGDLILSCTGLTSSLVMDISLSLNTNVTNALTGSFTDASLLVNGTNSQLGTISGYNSIDWPGVVLAPTSGGTATVRITNVRADASLLGAANLQSAPITGVVSVSSATTVPVTNASQTLAFAGPTLVFVGTPSTNGTQTTIPLQYEEASVGAFHPAAGTTQATRLRVVVSGIPSNVQVSAPVFPNEGSARAQLYSADANGLGGTPVSGVGGYQQLVVSSQGVATATWVVLSADQGQFETDTFPLMLTGTNVSSIQIAASLGPVSSVSVASATAPVPRFRDFSVPQALVNLRTTSSLQVTGNNSAALSFPSRQDASKLRRRTVVGSNVSGVAVDMVTNDNSDPTAAATNTVIRGKPMGGGIITDCEPASNCMVAPDGSEATVTVGTLEPKQTVTMALTIEVPADSFTASGTAAIQADFKVDSDQNPADLSSSQSSSVVVVNSSFLSQAAPLTVSHSGNFIQGQPSASYTISVEGSATGGTVAVRDFLPSGSGLTATSIAGPGWACTLSTTTCSRSDAAPAGGSYPPITLMVSVAANVPAPSTVLNQVNLLGANGTQFSASDSTLIEPAFTDVDPANSFLPAIDLLLESAITSGCNPSQYCPTNSITLDQMAVFVVRSVIGSDNFTYSTSPHFTDVPASNLYFPWIQKMQELGIAQPCGTNLYCPSTPVTRGVMAILIIRARYDAPTPPNSPSNPFFTDVPSSRPDFTYIQKMKQIGITSGCSPTTYCPDDPVTRGEMAVFIMRGEFNQLLPANTPVLVWASPSNASVGNTVTVTIAGQNTNFATGMTQVSAGAGITVSNVTVANGTMLTAQFAVAAGAVLGPQSIVVTTGSEEAILPNGFLIHQ